MIAHNISYTLLLAYFRFLLFNFQDTLVGQSGLEPPTSRLSVVCSSQLSYWPIGGDERNRTADPLLARQVLSQLSYTPIVYRVLPSYALFEDSFLSEEILKIKQCTSIARLRILLAAFFFKCLPHFFSNSFTRSLTP